MKSDTSQNRMKLGLLLRKLRLEAGLRQEDLAHKLNRPQSYVSKFESGDRVLNIFELIDFCDALNIKLGDVVDEIEELL